jgi:hypothetical protein
MDVFQITIERQSIDCWPVLAELRGADDLVEQQVSGAFRLLPDARENLMELELLPEQYGMMLRRALFGGAVGTLFSQARWASKDGLRVLLAVEADDLRDLRWERLCAPFSDSDWGQLALRQQSPFSPYLQSVSNQRLPTIGRVGPAGNGSTSDDQRLRVGCQSRPFSDTP